MLHCNLEYSLSLALCPLVQCHVHEISSDCWNYSFPQPPMPFPWFILINSFKAKCPRDVSSSPLLWLSQRQAADLANQFASNVAVGVDHAAPVHTGNPNYASAGTMWFTFPTRLCKVAGHFDLHECRRAIMLIMSPMFGCSATLGNPGHWSCCMGLVCVVFIYII